MSIQKVAINGFGRIGRAVMRAYMENKNLHSVYEIVAINDLADAQTLAHLYQFDSIYGRAKQSVTCDDNSITIDGKKIKIFKEKDPTALPWQAEGVTIVIESTGLFTKKADMQKHLQAGAKKVLLSAPAASAEDVDLTTVIGVNDGSITKDMTCFSNASCTTNSMGGTVKAIHEAYGIEKGFMTTVHSYTSDQRLHDAPHKDMRRARAAAFNIVPSSTGAAKAIGLVIPELKGKLDGFAVRVPTPVGSLTDMSFVLQKSTTAEEVNATLKKATETYLKGTVEYSTDPLVVSDIVGNPHSAIIDSQLTKVMDGTLLKVCTWYDNEWGFSNRLAHLAEIVAKQM